MKALLCRTLQPISTSQTFLLNAIVQVGLKALQYTRPRALCAQSAYARGGARLLTQVPATLRVNPLVEADAANPGMP